MPVFLRCYRTHYETINQIKYWHRKSLCQRMNIGATEKWYKRGLRNWLTMGFMSSCGTWPSLQIVPSLQTDQTLCSMTRTTKYDEDDKEQRCWDRSQVYVGYKNLSYANCKWRFGKQRKGFQEQLDKHLMQRQCQRNTKDFMVQELFAYIYFFVISTWLRLNLRDLFGTLTKKFWWRWWWRW